MAAQLDESADNVQGLCEFIKLTRILKEIPATQHDYLLQLSSGMLGGRFGEVAFGLGSN
jgi:hypothetical protein